MSTTDSPSPVNQPEGWNDIWDHLRLPKYRHEHAPIRSANDIARDRLSPLDRVAIAVTNKVSSFGFFLIIFTWTILWTGYNVLATEVKPLHWTPFDAFPAFVAYLLISNVIQILLMPLIMVGQSLQGRHSETRAELDFQINQKAEKEVTAMMQRLEHNTELLIQLMRHLKCQISAEDLQQIARDTELAERIASLEAKVSVE